MSKSTSDESDNTENKDFRTRPKTRELKHNTNRHHTERKSSCQFHRYDEDVCPFPSQTNQWSIVHLDSIGIKYDDTPSSIDSLLDMIFKETGMFHPLTEAQREVVKQLQDQMTFSSQFSDVLDFATLSSLKIKPDPNIYEEILRHGEEQELLCTENISHERLQDFVTHLLMMIDWMKIKRSSNSVFPKAAFKDLFKIFINMCGLTASDGALWESELVMFGNTCHRLKSEVDIAITSQTSVRKSRTYRNLVSIVQVKSFNQVSEKSSRTLLKERLPYRKASDTESSETETESSEEEKDDLSEPCIFHDIGRDVLGQHGSEILAHIDQYGGNLLSGDKYVYRPGVIVIGTKVTFTLLVCSVKHLLEIKDRTEVSRQNKAIIYYSDQKDLLKKNDRDLLLESFARLKNSKI